jgi:hypothetical protein
MSRKAISETISVAAMIIHFRGVAHTQAQKQIAKGEKRVRNPHMHGASTCENILLHINVS